MNNNGWFRQGLIGALQGNQGTSPLVGQQNQQQPVQPMGTQPLVQPTAAPAPTTFTIPDHVEGLINKVFPDAQQAQVVRDLIHRANRLMGW